MPVTPRLHSKECSRKRLRSALRAGLVAGQDLFIGARAGVPQPFLWLCTHTGQKLFGCLRKLKIRAAILSDRPYAEFL
jgi:hypothetical protein